MHRILIIDDNEAIHSDFRKILAAQETGSAALDDSKAALFGTAKARVAPRPVFDVSCASQGQDGLGCVRTAVSEGRPFAVAFVDMRMPPGWDGLQTIERLWEADPDLQVVICSAFSDHSWEEISARLGLTDRLLILKKPFDPIEVVQLAAALSEKWELKGKVALKFDELERLVTQRTSELAHAALHDKLTGLPNRAMLVDRLREMMGRDGGGTRTYAVLFLDFDRFKVVNDSLGHETGDELLIEIARRITACLESDEVRAMCDDTVAVRLGGDEFVVCVGGLHDREGAARIAERLLGHLAAPHTLKGYTLTTTASIGIATSDIGYAEPEEVVRDADIAMYHAKAAGKARFVFFDRPMHARVVERLALEQSLRGIVERGELVVHYQPIVCVSSGALKGFEALVRWNHPERGLVYPDGFIAVAEDTGAIVPIGSWVLHEACRQMGEWRRGHPDRAGLVLSVNVSARQLISDVILDTVKSALTAGAIEPAFLILEITESAVMDDPEHTTLLMGRLRELGVQLYMDDFGTGYTSLSHLHRLPLTGLKIDRGFMRSISERREYAAVVHAIVVLAQNLGIAVVAEGVELAEHLAMLQALDCEYMQGYLLGRPCAAGEAERMLTDGVRALAA